MHSRSGLDRMVSNAREETRWWTKLQKCLGNWMPTELLCLWPLVLTDVMNPFEPVLHIWAPSRIGQ